MLHSYMKTNTFINKFFSMRSIYLALFFFSFFNLSSQNTPVITKATATWCPNCGAWAWDFMEAMKEDFQSGPAIILGAHFQGSDIENDASIWFAKNLGATSRPVFYLNNDRISVGSNWSPVLDGMEEMITDINESLTAEVAYNSVLIEEGKINVSADIRTLPSAQNKLYINTYVFENNVKANQSQQGPNALHPNVIRASMTSDLQGMEITDLGDFEFSMDVDATWQEDELGIVTIIWEEDAAGSYKILASISATNISLLSATDQILDAALFSFSSDASTIFVTTADDAKYSLQLTDMSGRKVIETSFSGETELNKRNLNAGMYVLTLSNAKGRLSQQFFVN